MPVRRSQSDDIAETETDSLGVHAMNLPFTRKQLYPREYKTGAYFQVDGYDGRSCLVSLGENKMVLVTPAGEAHHFAVKVRDPWCVTPAEISKMTLFSWEAV